MEPTRDELYYYVSFVLLDEASRPTSGKRQTAPMNGFWMSRTNPVGMRLSDAAHRRVVCIEDLCRVGGLSVTKAAEHIASVLGRNSWEAAEGIRVMYHQDKGRGLPNTFHGQFLSWREWLLKSGAHTLQQALGRYETEFGKLRRRRMEQLFEDVRRDPVQNERHRFWVADRAQKARDRIQEARWKEKGDWQFLATDHWALGVYSMELGDLETAKRSLASALEVWTTRGTVMSEINPNIQRNAIAQLKAELARLDA